MTKAAAVQKDNKRDVPLNTRYIRIRLIELGMSQADLARKAGMGIPSLSQVMNGRTYRSTTLARLADALECNPIDLIDTSGFAPPHMVAQAAKSGRALRREFVVN